jgi:hypothetical protein
MSLNQPDSITDSITRTVARGLGADFKRVLADPPMATLTATNPTLVGERLPSIVQFSSLRPTIEFQP